MQRWAVLNGQTAIVYYCQLLERNALRPSVSGHDDVQHLLHLLVDATDDHIEYISSTYPQLVFILFIKHSNNSTMFRISQSIFKGKYFHSVEINLSL